MELTQEEEKIFEADSINYALLVAIEKYQHIGMENLPSTKVDLACYQKLLSDFNFEIEVLEDDEATAHRLLDYFADLQKKIMAQK